jgi:uncharacterized protein YggE
MKSTSRLFAFVFLLVSLVQPALAEPELKGLPTELTEYLKDVPKTVTVTGESEVKVEADKAIASLRVRTENKSFQEALRLNQGIRAKIIAFLNERGVAADKIQASKFSTAPQHAIFSDKIKNYIVENVLKITVHNEKEFQAIANAADNWSEAFYDGATFEHSDKQEMKMKALRQACDNAIARKKVFEDALGVKLIPKKFSESAIVEPRILNRGHYSSDFSKMPAYEPVASAQTGSPPGNFAETMSSFGELIFKAQVAVEYSLETK